MTVAVQKTMLYASYVSPYPANSGERIRAAHLIAALRHLGYRVEAIVGNYDRVDLKAKASEGVRFHEIPFAWPRLRQAADVYVRPNAAFLRQVEALHRQQDFSAILLDYGFMGAQIAPLSWLGVPVILGTHNLESALTGQAQKQSFAAGIAIRLRQAIEAAHERWFFPAADAVLCVSDDDRTAYERFIPKGRVHVVPNFIDVDDAYGETLRDNRIIMTGSFSNFQNVAGLTWFLREVWDEDLWTRTTLCIAGRDSDRVAREFPDVRGMVALGARESLIAEIARSRCAIVPLAHGGGTRLKCLEAMAARTPVVTTSKGCQGIAHGETFRLANTADAFKTAILDVLTYPDRARDAAGRARAIFDRDYSLSANAGRLQRALDAAALHAQGRRENQAQKPADKTPPILSRESIL